MSNEIKTTKFKVPKFEYGQRVLLFDTEKGVLNFIVDSASISDEGVSYYLKDFRSSFSYGMKKYDENSLFETKEGLIEWVNKKLKE